MKRVFEVDVLRCRCGARREMIALITRPDAVHSILGTLGLPAVPPPIQPSR